MTFLSYLLVFGVGAFIIYQAYSLGKTIYTKRKEKKEGEKNETKTEENPEDKN